MRPNFKIFKATQQILFLRTVEIFFRVTANFLLNGFDFGPGRDFCRGLIFYCLKRYVSIGVGGISRQKARPAGAQVHLDLRPLTHTPFSYSGPQKKGASLKKFPRRKRKCTYGC